MRFENKKEQFFQTIQWVALIISLGAIFFQIWVLISAVDAYLKGRDVILFPSMILSGLALLACGVSVALTNLNFLKGIRVGRSKTYEIKK